MNKSKNNDNIRVVTFGCRLNSAESETIDEYLSEFQIKDVMVINSCAVTSESERQLRQTIRKIRRQKPDITLALTGCASHIRHQDYMEMSEIDFIIDNIHKLNKDIYRILHEKMRSNIRKEFITIASSDSGNLNSCNDEFYGNSEIKLDIKGRNYIHTENNDRNNDDRNENKMMAIKSDIADKNNPLHDKEQAAIIEGEDDKTAGHRSRKRVRKYIPVQNGCNHRCTFCIIPYGRGPSTSAPMSEILTQVKSAVLHGASEVVLTGVDITDYGSNLPSKPSLGSMLRRLFAMTPEIKRIRLSSIDVAEIDSDLWYLIEHEPRLMPYFHLSLQSGDDMILKRMLRRHSTSQALDFCRRAREMRSIGMKQKVGIGCDVIAGFPTESEEMFENTCNFMIESKLVYLHVFPYSKREGTPAARMPQVDKQIATRRAAILRAIGKDNLIHYYNDHIVEKSKLKIVIESNGRGHAEDFSLCKIDGYEVRDEDIGAIVELEPYDIDCAGDQPMLLCRRL